MRDRLPVLRRRMQLVNAVRAFLIARDYLEVETPYVVETPGEEVHLRCFATAYESADGRLLPRYLHTSPEFAMKKILAQIGCSIFQFARVWRNNELSATHLPEFTMLEWYRPNAGLPALMDEVESLFHHVLAPEIVYGEHHISLVTPFERLTMREAFARYAGFDLFTTLGDAGALATAAGIALRERETWDDLFYRLLLERVEPYIGRSRPTFLTHWPASLAALARLDPNEPRVALRFELYAGGLELANAFEELTDAKEQKRRFLTDRALRGRVAPDQNWPLDEDLLAALKTLAPCSGIALGFDRLVMLALGAPRIHDVVWMSEADRT